MIFWKDEYSIGKKFIDEQHKKLFDIANKMDALLKNNFSIDKYDKIIDLIEELKDYTIFHFKEEEEYLLKHKYKKFLSHKVEHDEFIKKFSEIDFKRIDEGQDEYIRETFEFVYNWIVDHILKRDKEYALTLEDNE